MAEERKGPLQGFKEFLLRGNVVDLAIAVVIGAAFGRVVTAFVHDMLTPVISIAGKHTNFADLVLKVRGARFYYGDFINELIGFVIVAAVVFFVVVVPINYLVNRRKQELAAGDDDALSDEAKLLREIRDLLAAQRGQPPT